MCNWDPGSFQPTGDDDDDLPCGWGEEQKADLPIPPKHIASRQQGDALKPPRRPLPSLFTNAHGPGAVPKGLPPKAPSLPWAVQDHRSRAIHASGRHRQTSVPTIAGLTGGVSSTPDATLEEARARLAAIRKSRRRRPLEDTLADLATLQEQVHGVRARSSSLGRHRSASPCLASDTRSFALPQIRPGRSASVPVTDTNARQLVVRPN
mmetsp:Transcript_131383/g.262151  ORF Transcript_131383/g.262151 Transcript_131383/m.262151 type:complete len:208 (+) Transcript_131383:51-674(+)